MKIQLDMYQTIAAAVLVLMLGKYLKRKCSILEKFCIPAPVIGGVIFAVFTCICYVTGIAEFSFDDILKDVCMVFFFTSVGFQANLKVLKSGGKALIVFLGLVIGLIFCADGEEGAPPRLVYRNGYACPEDPEFWLGGHYRTRAAAALSGLRTLERFAAAPEALETYEVSVDADGWVEGFESG